MNGYRTHVVISDPDHMVLRGLPFRVGQRVEVVLLEESEQTSINEVSFHILEQDWLRAGAKNPAFDFLADADEDIYNLNDGMKLQ